MTQLLNQLNNLPISPQMKLKSTRERAVLLLDWESCRSRTDSRRILRISISQDGSQLNKALFKKP